MSDSKDIQSTRNRILETGLRLFSKKGYLGATTREIAKEAGIAEVTLFRYFLSKENLLEEVINTYTFLPALKGLMPEIDKMPYEKALTIAAKKFLETLSSSKDLIQIMHSEILRYPEKIKKTYYSFIDEMLRTLALYFEKMQKKGILGRFDTESAAMAFIGMFFSFFNVNELMGRKKYRTVDTDTTIKEFVKLFVRGTLRNRIK